MGEWQTFNTPPRTTPVDLWLVPPRKFPKGHEWKAKYSSGGHRQTDCLYDKTNDSWIKDGKWVVGRNFYNEDGDSCFDPADKSDEATIATHWMMPPSSPIDAHDDLCSIHDAGACGCGALAMRSA